MTPAAVDARDKPSPPRAARIEPYWAAPMRGPLVHPSPGSALETPARHGRAALVGCRRSNRLIRQSRVLNEGHLLGSHSPARRHRVPAALRPPPRHGVGPRTRQPLARLGACGETGRSRNLPSGRRA